MNNHELITLINEALKSENNIERQKAESRLFQIRKNNLDQFFLSCANLLINDNENNFNRQSASTLLINSIRAKDLNKYLWDLLQPQTRSNVKGAMLNSLVDPQSVIVRSGANVISHIAVIEIPRNEWLNLVDILAENTTYNDINVRKASILTIGNICQQFHEASVTIQPRACQQFLGGIMVGINEKGDASIVEQSMKALRNSLSFLRPILSEQIYRDQVFKIIYQRIKQESDDRTANEALIQFCKNCYQYLGKYLQYIIPLVVNQLQQRNENTILGLEVLDTIGSQYLERVQDAQDRTNHPNNQLVNYLVPIQENILPHIMRCLLIENKADLEFPEMRNSAAKTLSTFASIGNRETVDLIANGAASCLKSEELGHQQATALLLSALCENYDHDYVGRLINDAFDPVLQLLNSPTEIVLLNTLNGLIPIAQFNPSLFYNHRSIREIINKFFDLIDPNKSNITTAVLIILKNVTQNIDSTCVLLVETDILLTRIVNCYEQFLENYEGPCKDYTEKCVLVIMNCLIKMKNRQVILQMMEFLINKYQYYYKRDVSDQRVRLCSLASILHTCILALENMIPQEGLIKKLCQLIDKHIHMFGIEEEALNIISSMAITFNKAFEPKTENYWMYIQSSLDQISQPRTFKAALCCVGDFSRVYSQVFTTKELHILERLLVIIHGDFDREIKINILACIADLMLGLGVRTTPYVKQILSMVNISFQAVYELSNNPNDKQYLEELKKGLIDMYACLTFAVNGGTDTPKSEEIFNHFTFLATFIVRTCDRSENPTIEYLKICLYLIFDTMTFYWKHEQYRNTFRQIVESPQIKKLVEVLDNFKQRQDIRELQDLIHQRNLTLGN